MYQKEPMKIIYSLLLLFLVIDVGFAQDSAIDSLNILIERSNNDTTKVQLMLNLSKKYFDSDPNKAILISEQAKVLSESINYNSGVAYSFKNIGIGYYFLSDYVQAMLYWQRAKTIFEEINDVVGVSNMLSNMGAVYSDQGDHFKSLEMNLQSLKLAEDAKDTLRIATALLNLSTNYAANNDYDRALGSIKKSLLLSEATKNDETIGFALLKYGEIHLELSNYDSSLIYINKSVQFLRGTEYYVDALILLGTAYLEKNEYEKAIKYLNLSYNKALESGNNKLTSLSLNGLALAHEESANLGLAIELYEKSILSAKEISNSNDELLDAYAGLMRLYFIQGNNNKGSEYQSLHLAVKDSIFHSIVSINLVCCWLNT